MQTVRTETFTRGSLTAHRTIPPSNTEDDAVDWLLIVAWKASFAALISLSLSLCVCVCVVCAGVCLKPVISSVYTPIVAVPLLHCNLTLLRLSFDRQMEK